MKNKKKEHLYLYIACYCVITDDEINTHPSVRFPLEKIYAPDNDKAFEIAENKREVFDVIEKTKTGFIDFKKETILVSLRRPKSKRVVYFHE